MGKLFLVYEGVGRRRVRHTIGRIPDFDEGLGQLGEAAEVRAKALPESLHLSAEGYYPRMEVAAGSAAASVFASSFGAERAARLLRSLAAISAMV